MFLRVVLQRVLFFLFPCSLLSVICLYLYPVLQGCAFPLPKDSNETPREPVWSSLLTPENGVVNTLFQHAADWSSELGSAPRNSKKSHPEPAIFRLLVLADPQIEGDSSLPPPEDAFVPRLRRHWMKMRSALVDELEESESHVSSSHLSFVATVLKEISETIFFEDIPTAFQAARKRLDLLGNDYYLAHIYRTLSWWSRPTHVTVLGDLIGSQWVTDEEFENRGWRFWNRVFRGGERVSDEVTITGKKKSQEENDPRDMKGDGDELETLQRYNSSWNNRIINIAGNHDIGYAGDVSKQRLERFEREFGRANWDIRFAHPTLGNMEAEAVDDSPRPTLHIINLNDLTLDGPSFDQEIQSDSYTYINDVLTHRSYPVEDQTSFTLLLTHVPLHKRDGICVDGPYFTYFEEDDQSDQSAEDSSSGSPRFHKGGLREQNHLSEHVSTNGILEGIFGMSGDAASAPVNGKGRRGLILTGHDHEGCDVVHFVNRANSSDTNSSSDTWHWNATRYNNTSASPTLFTEDNEDTPFIREVTLRSMMGQYGGNAALLSLWFDSDPSMNRWRYEIQMCPAGVQHIWWAVHGSAFASLIGVGIVVGLRVLEFVLPAERENKRKSSLSKTTNPERNGSANGKKERQQ